MSDDKYEGHNPQTCNYQICMARVTTPCPFVKEDSEPTPGEDDPVKPCSHEWRQLVEDHPQHFRFYCIHCAVIQGSD
jgi:hypothetical protein